MRCATMVRCAGGCPNARVSAPSRSCYGGPMNCCTGVMLAVASTVVASSGSSQFTTGSTTPALRCATGRRPAPMPGSSTDCSRRTGRASQGRTMHPFPACALWGCPSDPSRRDVVRMGRAVPLRMTRRDGVTTGTVAPRASDRSGPYACSPPPRTGEGLGEGASCMCWHRG